MRNLLLTILVFSSIQAFAHGEDKPGPHGGFISMPGAFHVELVPSGARTVKAYLLDMTWKNPTTKDSSIAITNGKVSAKCSAEKDHFVCDFPPTIDLKKPGKLELKAIREKAQGNAAVYSLPFALKPAAPQQDAKPVTDMHHDH